MSTLRFVIDHLWQSTLVVAGVALAVSLFRAKHAGLRYGLWLAASVKFAIPFAALNALGAFIGSRAPWRAPQVAPAFVNDFASPLSAMSSATASGVPTTLAAVPPSAGALVPAVIATLWLAGCVAALAVWAVRWGRAARTVRDATPLDAGREVDILRQVERTLERGRPLPMRATNETLEPGVFGVWRPVLLWPRSMSAHLSDDQIETILIHELSHVRRRDNLTAIAHSLVQCVFWFHPIVWWIGAKLVDERERACDEDVVRLGRDRRVYAESLLKTCQFCVAAPVTCMAGVTGSDLKRRVTRIMAGAAGTRLGVVGRTVLTISTIAVLAVPVVGGVAGVPQLAGPALPGSSKTFEVASVRQNKEGALGGGTRSGDGRLTVQNSTVGALLRMAFPSQEGQIVGGPDWFKTDRFDILAKADAATSDADLKIMIQNLLIDRFAIRAHVETRNLPIYAMVLARPDGQLGPSLQNAAEVLHGNSFECATTGQPCGSGPASAGFSGSGGISSGRGGGGIGAGPGIGRGPNMGSKGATMENLARMLAGSVGRTVVDRTGLEGKFDFSLRYSRATAGGAESDAPDIFTAVQEQLGLKLEATRGPVEVLVIDSAERPVNDDFPTPELR